MGSDDLEESQNFSVFAGTRPSTINYLRRKIDTGADHPLIRTIRGVGYQIGGNHHIG